MSFSRYLSKLGQLLNSSGQVLPSGLATGTDFTIAGLTVGKGAGSVATNTAVGASALAANTTAIRNTGVGYQALKSAIDGGYNVALGPYAGSSITSGTQNTAIGDNALPSTTTSSNNTAIGQGSLANNSTGANNTSVGQGSLTANTTASNNTAVGYQAGYSTTTGSGGNVFIGTQAGYGVTTGNGNTFVGCGSGTGVPAGYYVTTGNKNTILGAYGGNQGGLDIRTSSNNIVLSDGDGNPALSFADGGTWSIRGGTTGNTGAIKFRNSSFTKYWEIASNDGTWFFADADFTHYAYLLQNMTSWGFGSDRRMKKDIVDLDYGLDAVMAMKPKRYTFIASGKEDIGFIAQELKEIVPEAVSGEEIEYLETDTAQERASKSLGIGKELLIPVLVKAIQELKAEFDAYKEAHP